MSRLPNVEEVIAWAREAGNLLLEGLGRAHEVRYKGLTDPVTEMDRASEALLIQRIRAAFPEHMIITEESGVLGEGEAAYWYIDPLDGTVNYAHGLPIFAVSVAYVEAGVPQLGVVLDPSRDECFYAVRGQGAYLNGRPLRPAETADLIHSLLVTGFPYDMSGREPDNLDLYAHFARRSQGVRRLGSAALDLCYVAAGRLDGYWEMGVAPWDIAAGMVIAEEAGVVVTRLTGEPDPLRPPCSLLAANPRLYPHLLAEIRAVQGLSQAVSAEITRGDGRGVL
ncbi:inositol monophosphatase family protein [uncultured Thermanaerothrix sp.]|uniref:inositol monophosphatase family protein n=1 Tax=uncultured Thermanaerothrix sp. TaxID=1195149 RepID=UPI002625640C|nr:inositol monophosphatase family protein [uncultured Thermanaerothrix sp.]